MEVSSILRRLRTLLHTEFAALLARADVSQAAFATHHRLHARQVNNWARGRAAVPLWAIALAAVLQDTSPEAIQILLEEIQFAWHETLGVPPNADAAALRRAMAWLALIYHPDKGGQPDLMSRVNTAYERAQRRLFPVNGRMGTRQAIADGPARQPWTSWPD